MTAQTNMIGTVGVIDSEWESVADQSVEILKDDPVGASSDSETLDVRSEGRYKIVTETDLPGLIEKESLVQVLECVLGNLNPIYGRPMDDFTSSQSRSFDSLARSGHPFASGYLHFVPIRFSRLSI